MENSTLVSDRKVRVCLTVDAEFSVGGALSNPRRNEPIGGKHVWCPVDGRSQGLGFILDTLGEFGLRATFFVETLQVAYFGDQPMREIARAIAAAGHDVQLHLHPVWAVFDRPDWRSWKVRRDTEDNIHGRGVSELAGWMSRGIETIRRWGLPAPTAFRPGNMMVDRTVYRAMSQVGLGVSSSVAASLFQPQDEALRLEHGVHSIEGILELPVYSYRGVGWGKWAKRKSWTIMGTSAAESRFLLERAHSEQVSAVVLLTHCHEFVSGDMRGRLSASRVNQARFRDLCAFLESAQDRFETTRITDAACLASLAAPTCSTPISVPNPLAAQGVLQNGLRDYGFI